MLVASGNNRTNSSGQFVPGVKYRSSLTYNNIVPANGTLNVSISGLTFYVIFTTAAIIIKPDTGSDNSYVTGTGLDLDESNAFSLLQVINPNPFPVVFSIFVGFDQYVDRRVYLNNLTQPQVVYPTYSVANSATNVNIIDLSGQEFTDINGGKWYAITRTALLVGNPDSGTDLLIQRLGGTGASPAILPVYARTSVNLPISGNYCLNNGGGTINAIVSEIYASIPKT